MLKAAFFTRRKIPFQTIFSPARDDDVIKVYSERREFIFNVDLSLLNTLFLLLWFGEKYVEIGASRLQLANPAESGFFFGCDEGTYM